MPSIPPGGKVLVTGANGYIASWIVRYLLEAGFHVRGSIRSEAKGVFLKETWATYGDKFELIIIKDMTVVSRVHINFCCRNLKWPFD